MSRSTFGHIRHEAEDRHRIYWTDNEGKPHSRRIRGTSDEAELELAKIKVELLIEKDAQTDIEDMKWSVFWDVIVVPTFTTLQAHTAYDYKRLWKKELKPIMGDMMVGDTTPKSIQRIIDNINAPSVQSYAKRLLRKICNMAVDEGLLDRCPVSRNTKTAPIKRRKKTGLLAREASHWIERTTSAPAAAIRLCCVGGGMSPEEAWGLIKERVKRYERNGNVYAIIEVCAALTMVGGDKDLKDTKNGYRRRIVAVGAPFAEPLLALCEGTGPLYPSRAVRSEGEPYTAEDFASPTTITNSWRKWCEKNEVPYVRIGDMRTIWSTWHMEAGTQDSAVQEAMGHSDGTTRGSNYIEFSIEAALRVADSLTSYFDSL